jgi:type I site-specific restriction-modification system R (restriction) subunit
VHPFPESTVEQVALAWLESLRWAVKYGLEIAPDTPGAARHDYGQIVLENRLQQALDNLNLDVHADALEERTSSRRIWWTA